MDFHVDKARACLAVPHMLFAYKVIHWPRQVMLVGLVDIRFLFRNHFLFLFYISILINELKHLCLILGILPTYFSFHLIQII